MCIEREIEKAELGKRTGLSSATYTKLGRNHEANLSALLKIVNCNAGDVMGVLPDDAIVAQDEAAN